MAHLIDYQSLFQSLRALLSLLNLHLNHEQVLLPEEKKSVSAEDVLREADTKENEEGMQDILQNSFLLPSQDQ